MDKPCQPLGPDSPESLANGADTVPTEELSFSFFDSPAAQQLSYPEMEDWPEPEVAPKCLILAAGQGSRLQEMADSKPLYPLLGVPIIERVIRTAVEAGLDAFYVVVGHHAEQVCAFLEDLAKRLGVCITPIHNPNWAHHENGYSLLMARAYLDEPFVLLMADHLVEPALIQTLLAHMPAPGEVALAVDGRLDNPLVDAEDVTRVWVEEGRVWAIGKGLTPFNGYDTGVFLCTPAVFQALEATLATGDSTLSGAIQYLAEQGQVHAVDVSGLFWIDLDSPQAVRLAEDALIRQLQTKATDGPIARRLNRPLSGRLTRVLARYPVTPNQITLAAFVLAGVAAALFATGWRWTLVVGGVLAQLASVVDGCDGEIARLKYLGTSYGGWLDAVLDRYADALLLFGLTWHLHVQGAGDWVWPLGVAALVGSFMVSYTAVKYDDLIRSRVRGGHAPGLRIGRDLRLLVICVAAVLNLVAPGLALLAVVMNGETVRRLWVTRRMVTG